MVDVKALKDKYAKQRSVSPIFAVVLGTRGAGKSTTAAGTWPQGTKILHVAFLQEDHGIEAGLGIAKDSEDIIPIIVDVDDKKGKLNHDESLNAFLALLQDDIIKAVDVVVIDGLSALDVIVANHSTVNTATGYEKKRCADMLYDKILHALKVMANVYKKHVVITCSTEVRMRDGEVWETPSLRGGSAVDSVIGACNVILAMGKVEQEDKPPLYTFIFDSNIKKSGTKMNKDNYVFAVNPRITGVDGADIPQMMKASFTFLMKFKAEKTSKKKE
jgi:hypothetical protein